MTWRHPVRRGCGNHGGADAGAARARLADPAFVHPHRQCRSPAADDELDVLPVGPWRVDDRSTRQVQRPQLLHRGHRNDHVRVRDVHDAAAFAL